MSTAVSAFAPVGARAGEEVKLAMQQLWLTGRILPAGARLFVRHIFRSAESKPLEVVYAFALPRDAALRRFKVVGQGFSARSELRPLEEAVKAYERGIEAGHLAALARQYGDGLVNLSLGNLQPGETVTVLLEVLAGVEPHDGGFRFRFPFTLAPGYHPRARAAAAGSGRGEIELPEDEFGDLLLPAWSKDSSGLHEVGFDLELSAAQPLASVASPSHALQASPEGASGMRVQLGAGADVPNRDLVLEARTRESLAGVLGGQGKDGRSRFLAIVPSNRFGDVPAAARGVVFVLDRSGSMQGSPITQARKAIEACLATLGDSDQFNIVAFDDKTENFRPRLVRASAVEREAARQFLSSIEERGGTELAAGVNAAAASLAGASADLLIVTDGQVFGTGQILEKARSLGLRLHALGIGSASQDRFLSLLARETGGVSRFLTPRERVDIAAIDLFASIGRPVATGVKVVAEMPGGNIRPQPADAVFAGTPLIIYGECEGAGSLRLQWNSGSLAVPVALGNDHLGETLRLLHGSRLITDAESEILPETAAGRRQQGRVERRLDALSAEFGLATPRHALVAVVERAGDRPGQLPETRVVPVGLPEGVEFGAYFGDLRMASGVMRMAPPPMAALASDTGSLDMASCFARREIRLEEPVMSAESADPLVELAALLDPDGGLPGRDPETRVLASLLALLAFAGEGHTVSSGAFRLHVQRLTAFLQAGSGRIPAAREATLGEAIRLASSLPRADWASRALGLAGSVQGRAVPEIWDLIEAAVRAVARA